MKRIRGIENYHCEKASFVALCGFPGYYADRFNDVISFRRSTGRKIHPWGAVCGSGTRIEKLTLFDASGNRRQVSRRKVLINTYGVAQLGKVGTHMQDAEAYALIKVWGLSVFDQRELSSANRSATLEREAQEAAERAKKVAIETAEMLKEIHKDDFAGPKVPMHMLDPVVQKMILSARKHRRSRDLGDLY